MFDRDVTVWGSADGNEYLVKDLTTPHPKLLNVKLFKAPKKVDL